jgi:hypothetical protein
MPTPKDWEELDGLFGEPVFAEDPYANWGGGMEGDGTDGSGDMFGDPYANWGGGAGGDGTDGSGDSGGGFNLGSLFSGGGNALSALARGLGLNGSNAGSLISSLLPILGLAGGAINTNNATNRASQQLQDAARTASDQSTALIGGARDDFKPYMSAGTDALGKLQNMPQSNLAASVQPLGQSSALADKFKSMTLANLARRA